MVNVYTVHTISSINLCIYLSTINPMSRSYGLFVSYAAHSSCFVSCAVSGFPSFNFTFRSAEEIFQEFFGSNMFDFFGHTAGLI